MAGGARAHVDIERTVTIAQPDALRREADAGLFAALATPLFLVDGNNLLWRAAHGHPAPFPAADGRDITPLFRFFTLLRRSLGTYGLFAECVVVFDGAEAWTGRTDVDAGYKSNRSYEDSDLSFMGWLPEIRAALNCCGVAQIELPDHEADDVIATLTAKAGARPVRILSTDRDYFQLLSRTVAVLNPRSRPSFVDAAVIERTYGVRPDRWCDFRALAGDPSDGIPGLRGVGPKGAAALLRDAASFEDVLAGLDPSDAADVRRWRELIRLRTDVETGYELKADPTPTLPPAAFICRELGLV